MCVESCAIFHAQVPRKLERDTLTRTHRTPQSRHDKINPWNSLIKHITYNSRTLKVTRLILFAKWWYVLGLVWCAPGWFPDKHPRPHGFFFHRYMSTYFTESGGVFDFLTPQVGPYFTQDGFLFRFKMSYLQKNTETVAHSNLSITHNSSSANN